MHFSEESYVGYKFVFIQRLYCTIYVTDWLWLSHGLLSKYRNGAIFLEQPRLGKLVDCLRRILGDKCAYVAKAHDQESTGLQEQVHKEVVLALEIKVITCAKHQKPSSPKLQNVKPASQ